MYRPQDTVSTNQYNGLIPLRTCKVCIRLLTAGSFSELSRQIPCSQRLLSALRTPKCEPVDVQIHYHQCTTFT